VIEESQAPRPSPATRAGRLDRCRVFLCVTLLAAACGPVGRAAAPGSSNAGVRVAVTTVVRRDLANTLKIASELEPLQEIDVYAKVSGYIETLNVDWGSRVRQGDTLAILQIPELEQQLLLDESAYNVAELTYNRVAEVQRSRPELVAQEDIDVAHGKQIAAKAELERDRDLFSYSRITAPFDGVVTRLDAYKGALLPAGTSSNKGDLALCHLSQTSVLRVVIPVPERAVPLVHLGESVTVEVSSLSRALDGRIARVSGQIDPTTRTMHTEVRIPNPRYELVPGMYAAVELPLQVSRNALAVPIQAVQLTAEGRGTVLVVNAENRIEKRDITVGLETATEVEVVKGLAEGDRVVFGAQAQYQPGQVVTPEALDSGTHS